MFYKFLLRLDDGSDSRIDADTSALFECEYDEALSLSYVLSNALEQLRRIASKSGFEVKAGQVLWVHRWFETLSGWPIKQEMRFEIQDSGVLEQKRSKYRI